jgi:hypothetical protein
MLWLVFMLSMKSVLLLLKKKLIIVYKNCIHEIKKNKIKSKNCTKKKLKSKIQIIKNI